MVLFTLLGRLAYYESVEGTLQGPLRHSAQILTRIPDCVTEMEVGTDEEAGPIEVLLLQARVQATAYSSCHPVRSPTWL